MEAKVKYWQWYNNLLKRAMAIFDCVPQASTFCIDGNLNNYSIMNKINEYDMY